MLKKGPKNSAARRKIRVKVLELKIVAFTVHRPGAPADSKFCAPPKARSFQVRTVATIGGEGEGDRDDVGSLFDQVRSPNGRGREGGVS